MARWTISRRPSRRWSTSCAPPAARPRARAGARWRALVLVPTEGLRRLCRQLAERVGLEALEIALVDDWLFARARAVFARLPERLGGGASAATIRLKRHPAVRAVL